MSYRGTGSPQFGTNALSYTLPKPVKGGRNEKFEPIQEVYENILHQLIPGERVLRFAGEYEFSIVPTATLNILVTAYNHGRIIMWAPHSDVNKIRYAVIVRDLNIVPVNGLIDYDGLTIKVESIDVTNMIPTSDNIFRLGNKYPYLASIEVIKAGDFNIGADYVVRTLGTTDFLAIGGVTLSAGAFVTGERYIILTVGTTDFTLIGATANTVGLAFICTGAGAGTGTILKTNFTATGAGSGTGTATEKET